AGPSRRRPVTLQPPGGRARSRDAESFGKQPSTEILESPNSVEVTAMVSQTLFQSSPKVMAASQRAGLLAERLEEGAAALMAFAGTITDAEWRVPVSASDRRPVGV